MRQLTAKQKKMLDKYLKETPSCHNVDTMDGDVYQEIDNINPCEIFYQNVNNYIWEKRMRGL
jgi:hypothetical protein